MSERERYEPLARRIAREVGIDEDTFGRQIAQESGWNPRAVSPSGAEGLGQLIPRFYPNVDRFDPEANLRAAAGTIRSYLDRFGGDDSLALAAYNAGPAAIGRWVDRFGAKWRAALTSQADLWPVVAGYGTPAKAAEAARYLDSILGPATGPGREDGTMRDLGNMRWVGSPHRDAGRQGLRPVAIVDHIMQGTLAAADAWFNNPAARVSAHFGVGRDGAIHQYVQIEDTAWANGRVNRPDLTIPWLADAVRRGVNPNLLTVSIEWEGRSGDAVPEAQYQASLALHRLLIAQLGIPADRDHIIGHYRIDSVDRAFCPGPGFPWDRLLADLSTAANPADPTPPADPIAPAITERQALDEIWRIAGLVAPDHPAEAATLRRMVGVVKDRGLSAS